MSEDALEFKPEEPLRHSCTTSRGYCPGCGHQSYARWQTEGTVTGRHYIRDPDTLAQHFYPNLKTVSEADLEGPLFDIDYTALEEAVLAPYSVDDFDTTAAFYGKLYSDSWGDVSHNDERGDEVS